MIRESEWTHTLPPGVEMPRQGWKVHLSTVPDEDRLLLARASALLFAAEIPFKFLTYPARLRARLNIWPSSPTRS
ncbi:class III lanthionine synthetase LanKC N-terminal domain-containing protein [Luethyella okanaganae]